MLRGSVQELVPLPGSSCRPGGPFLPLPDTQAAGMPAGPLAELRSRVGRRGASGGKRSSSLCKTRPVWV